MNYQISICQQSIRLSLSGSVATRATVISRPWLSQPYLDPALIFICDRIKLLKSLDDCLFLNFGSDFHVEQAQIHLTLEMSELPDLR